MTEYGALDRAFDVGPDEEPVAVVNYDLYGLDSTSPDIKQLDRKAEMTTRGIGGVALVATEADVVTEDDDAEAIRRAERAVAQRYGGGVNV